MLLRIFCRLFHDSNGGAGGIPVSGLALGTLRRGGISNLFCSGVFSRNMASAGGAGVLFGSNLSGRGSESLWGEGEGVGG